MYKVPVIIDHSNIDCYCKQSNCIRCKYDKNKDIPKNEVFKFNENEFTQISEESRGMACKVLNNMSVFNNAHIITYSKSSPETGGDPHIMFINNLTLGEIYKKIGGYFYNVSLSGFREGLSGTLVLYLSGQEKIHNDNVKIWIRNLSPDKRIYSMLGFIWYCCNNDNDYSIDNYISHILNINNEPDKYHDNYKNKTVIHDLFRMFDLNEETDHINFLKYKIKKYIKCFDMEQKFGNFKVPDIETETEIA